MRKPKNIKMNNLYIVHVSRKEWHSTQSFECFAKRPTEAIKKAVKTWGLSLNSVSGITKIL